MRFHVTSSEHSLLEDVPVGLIQRAVGSLENFSPFALGIEAQAVDIASDLDLLTQRKALDAPDDRFDDGHIQRLNQAASEEERERGS